MKMTEYVIEGGAFLTLNEIERANMRAGGHWFSPNTITFFSSEFYDKVFGGRWFVHSSQFTPSTGDPNPRRYHIAHATADGHVESLPGDKWPTLDFDDLEAAESFCEVLEAGTVTLDRFEYDEHVRCEHCPTFASWLVMGNPSCFQHTGQFLNDIKEL